MLKEKIQIGLGLWLLLSPWLLGFSSVSLMKWSNVLVGIAIFLINLWAVFDAKPVQPNQEILNPTRPPKL